MSLKVYVAGSSDELDRAENMIMRLRAHDIAITKNWTVDVRMAGHGNPPEATDKQRRSWAVEDLNAVERADVLWLLTPLKSSAGAWVEFGCAYRSGVELIASPRPRSIFSALAGHCFHDDEKAFEYLIARNKVLTLAAQPVAQLCARCDHPRENHSEFIDNQIASTTYVPERRHCLVPVLGGGLCGCHCFVEEV